MTRSVGSHVSPSMARLLYVLRVLAGILIVGWLAAVLTAGIAGLGVPVPVAVPIAGVIAVALGFRLRGHVAAILDTLATDGRAFGRPIWLALFATAAIVGVVTTLRLALFMADPTRVEYSLIPSDQWRVQHSCLSAYTEGVRFATAGDRNIYDPSHYMEARIGVLRVDPYHYPPPFLLVPWALGFVAPDFVALRSIWFTLQGMVLAIALVAIGRWVGGTPGLWAIGAGSLVLVTPSVIRTLQMGNAQMTIVPLAMMGLVLAADARATTGRTIAGGSLLAYATLSKIFPGALVLMLVTGRRWRAAATVAIVSVLLVGATVAAFGVRPFVDFVSYELPRLASGEAFPQTANPRTIANNISVYGLTGKLRLLGVTWLDPDTGRTIASLYGVFVMLLVAAAGWAATRLPATPDGRLARAQLWLAVLTLASLRSPFVPVDYGPIASLWLLALLAAGASSPRRRAGWLLAFTTLAAAGLLQRPPSAGPPTAFTVAFWTLIGGAVLLLNLAIVARVIARPEGQPSSEAAGVLPSPDGRLLIEGEGACETIRRFRASSTRSHLE